MYIESL